MPKLTVVLHTGSHLALDAVPGLGPSQDSPDFTPAMRQATALAAIDTALGDAGYDAEHNYRLCREELDVRQTVIRLNRRNTDRRWPKTPYRPPCGIASPSLFTTSAGTSRAASASTNDASDQP